MQVWGRFLQIAYVYYFVVIICTLICAGSFDEGCRQKKGRSCGRGSSSKGALFKGVHFYHYLARVGWFSLELNAAKLLKNSNTYAH
jgi:hypothetical protein